VLIVAYRNTEDLVDCLTGLGAHQPVLVVDNGEDDDVQQLCAERRVGYLRPEGNVGFAAAVNLGIARSGAGRDVCLVNPDARITAEQLGGLLVRLAERPRLAALSPSLRAADGQHQQEEWPVPSPLGAWIDALGLRRWLPGRTRFVVGAVLLLRREALVEVGGFDERFFLYSEETDWQLRAQRRGWEVAVDPQVVVSHLGAGSSNDEARRQALFHRSVEAFTRKWYGRVGWQVLRAAVVVGGLLRLLLGRPVPREHLRRVRLYVAGPSRVAARATDL
jgi:GT2 family glycosyltransferase